MACTHEAGASIAISFQRSRGQLCPQSLARLACEGVGPCYKTLNGRWVLYERADLDLWVSEHLSPARAHSAAHQVAKAQQAGKSGSTPSGANGESKRLLKFA